MMCTRYSSWRDSAIVDSFPEQNRSQHMLSELQRRIERMVERVRRLTDENKRLRAMLEERISSQYDSIIHDKNKTKQGPLTKMGFISQ